MKGMNVNMNKVYFPSARLIVKDYCGDINKLRKEIVYGEYSCIDTVVPLIRARGTIVKRNEQDGKIEIIGWQRDITRMRKLDVSLSFIVYITVNSEGIIEKASIDDSFNGGKGILCSKSYLESKLKSEFEGVLFDRKLASKLRLDKFKCFHIYEVMSSIYSSYLMFKDQNSENIIFEEDVIDVYAENGNLYLTGIQRFSGKEDTKYTIVLYDVFNNVTFDKEGYMNLKNQISAQFYINDELICEDELYQKPNDYIFIRVQKFLVICVDKLKAQLFPDFKEKMMNTNLVPGAFIGVIMQAIGIRTFSNNFNYIQYIMTAMQRPRKVPGCIGAILSEEEAEKYFDGFDLNNLT